MEDLDEIVHEFLVESHENLDQLDSDLVALEGDPGSRELLSSIFRTIHTIKGTSGFLAFNALEAVTHAGESLLVELREGRLSMDEPTTDALLRMVDAVRAVLASIEAQGDEGDVDVTGAVDQIQAVLAARVVTAADAGTDPSPAAAPATGRKRIVAKPARAAAPSAVDVPHQAEAPALETLVPPDAEQPTEPSRSIAEVSIRVDVDLLDALMRQVGELVLARNTITRLADGVTDVDLVRASQRLSLIASELQEGVMKTRMQPIEHVWSKVPRMVRDLASACGKKVGLEMAGGDTELDRGLLEAVKDPLTHLIRNAVDHGIETTEERLAAGKPGQGRLLLRAYHAGGQVVVEVSDDGRGIDPAAVAATAVRRGLRTTAQTSAMGTAELLQLLFLPGFSTAAAVTNVSGRGVGMDVVRTRIEGIGGAVDVESAVGTGTTWRLRIPLTLAIMPALTVECHGELYAIPQLSLLELVALDPSSSSSIEHVRTAPVYRLRGDLLPLVDLREVFEAPARGPEERTVIAVLQADSHRFGLVVDRVLNTEEIVVKPLAARLKAIGLYAGATLLGDGRVSLILDVQAIARRALTGDVVEAAEDGRAAQDAVGDTTQMLVADIGDGRRVAIPVSVVTRLEKLDAALVEHVGGREVVRYRGAITPVVRLAQVLGGAAYRERTDELSVVVHTHRDRSIAIVVDHIVDIVDDDARDHSGVSDLGLTGSTVLKDRVTELVDIRRVVADAVPGFFDEPVGDLVGSVA